MKRNADGTISRRNPLAYFGWLGLIGIPGIFYRSPWMMTCLLFFFFFSYWNVIPDELFWMNVRKAAVRALAVNIGFYVIGFLGLYIRAVKYRIPMISIVPGAEQVTVPGAALEQMGLSTLLLVFGFMVTVCSFFISLMYYRRREKKYTEEEIC